MRAFFATIFLSLLALALSPSAFASGIPATPVMTLYRFNGAADIPYYTADEALRGRRGRPAGTLKQGSSLIPCLVMRDGVPLTDTSGTPLVGFEIVVDSRTATPASTTVFEETVAKLAAMTVPNHHCDARVQHVISVRDLYDLEKPPFFDPPGTEVSPFAQGKASSALDAIVRAFHNSTPCERANRNLIGRRDALNAAWGKFIAENARRWKAKDLERAKHLDYTMRTALFEGHLDRGCSAYGACERNVIALSIRNRARETCSLGQGCSFPGDFQGVSSKVSQYNIWDEFLAQISGLATCFMSDRSSRESPRVRRMYEQSVGDIEQILYGDDRALAKIFPGTPISHLKNLRHYYHAPAMGKCFPQYKRVEYVSGAVARRGKDFALIANTRIKVGKKVAGGYRFEEFRVQYDPDRDVVAIENRYPGFVIDDRKVSLRRPASCPPYGIPRGCHFKRVERYRKTPRWLRAGRPLAIGCRVRDRGADCDSPERMQSVTVGDACDTQMRPIMGVR